MLTKDLLVTPVLILLIYGLAIYFKNHITDPVTKKIFIPALTLKLLSAIILGAIYQFYYEGGDTFFYFNQSKIVAEALVNEPLKGISLLLSDGNYEPHTLSYASRIHWYRFPTEFTVVKIAAIFNVITFNTYSSVAIFFSLFSFFGLWLMYRTLVDIRPDLKIWFAIASFFVPSVVFWGSGLLKDSLMMGCMGFLFYGFYQLFIKKRRLLNSIILIGLSIVILYNIRIYILLGFVPPALIWVFMTNNKKIKSVWARRIAAPLFFALGISFAYLFAVNITEGHSKYDLSQIPERTRINANYLYRVSLAQGGSAYYLGELDGTFNSMLAISPQAIVVTLFRPFVWEVRNVFMLISSIESTVFLLLTFFVFLAKGPFKVFKIIMNDPFLVFAVTFTTVMAFAIGLNSFNFGTLVRYKIPILPFFFSSLCIIYFTDNRPKGR